MRTTHLRKAKAISVTAFQLMTGMLPLHVCADEVVMTKQATSALPSQLSLQGGLHESDPEVYEAETRAAALLHRKQLPEARKLILAAIQKGRAGAQNNFELYYLLGLIDKEAGNLKQALKDLRAALESEKATALPSIHTSITITKRIGDLYYQLHDYKPALIEYKKALLESQTLPAQKRPNLLNIQLLSAIVGTLTRQNNLKDAEVYAKELLQATAERAKDGTTSDIISWFWAQVELMDIYQKSGNTAECMTARKLLTEALESILSLPQDTDIAGHLRSFRAVKREFLNEYMQDNPPSCLADYLWLSHNWHPYSLPLVRWEPDAGVIPKAAILCIHGLGLENRSFTSFAKAMTHNRYVVYALDIRGFGAWQSVQGQEDASFGEALADIQRVANFISELNTKIPIFLLGESMGGAIALRGGSLDTKNIAGIISSVPSAERYQQRRMSIEVAMHLLKAKDRPFDIGHTVAQLATSDEELRQLWETNPKAKLKLTPIELIKFDEFMRTTRDRCKSIVSTPVLIVQGLKDKLVKPSGSYEMFDNITCDNKTMTIIGDAEHLIFESEVQNDEIINYLCAWLEKRISLGSINGTTSRSTSQTKITSQAL